MNKKIKDFIGGLLAFAALLAGTAMTAQDAHSQQARNKQITLPTEGVTADGKYPIYKLEGELEDMNYRSGTIVYSPGDLLGNMKFVDPKDIGKGYKCQYVCKDAAGHIVGMNPAYRAMAGQ